MCKVEEAVKVQGKGLEVKEIDEVSGEGEKLSEGRQVLREATKGGRKLTLMKERRRWVKCSRSRRSRVKGSWVKEWSKTKRRRWQGERR